MCATAGACISETRFFSSAAVVPQLVNLPSSEAVVPHKVNLPSCVVGRRPLCHKVTQPRCEARRRHFIMTCDIFDTGQMNILALCYLFEKTFKSAYSRATLKSLKSTLHSTKLLKKLLK